MRQCSWYIEGNHDDTEIFVCLSQRGLGFFYKYHSGLSIKWWQASVRMPSGSNYESY